MFIAFGFVKSEKRQYHCYISLLYYWRHDDWWSVNGAVSFVILVNNNLLISVTITVDE